MSIQIRESVAEAPVQKGDKWRVVVARPGQGSSGYYSEEMFRRDAHNVIAPGGQAFINHDDDRNPQDMIGVYENGAMWDEDEKAVVADLTVFSHWKDFVREVGPHCGISIYCAGEADEDGNVTAIIEDALNGADLVARPGLRGSKLDKLYESAKALDSEKTEAVTVADFGKEMTKMDELKEAIAALTAQVTALVNAKEAKATEEAQAQADATAVAEAVETVLAAVKAVDEADLLAPQKESILAAAKRGEDVAPLIESAKAVKEAAVEALRESDEHDGVVVTSRKVESAVDLGKVFG